MKRKHLLFGLLILILTHYIHYLYNEFMKVRYVFHNTVFSTPDLPIKFYQVKVGDKRQQVEELIGQALFTREGYAFYSAPGDELFGSNYNVVFQVKYNADTVVEKRVIQDD